MRQNNVQLPQKCKYEQHLTPSALESFGNGVDTRRDADSLLWWACPGPLTLSFTMFRRNLLVVLLLLMTFTLFGQEVLESSARRYVDLSLSSGQQIFEVLSRPEVQNALHLSDEQLKEIKNVEDNPPDQRPSDTPDEENNRLSEYLQSSSYKILTSSQTKRFQEIMRQVDGLKLLRSDDELRFTLSLSHDQIEQINRLFASYEKKLTSPYELLRRQMITSLGPDQTIGMATKKANSLIRVIKNLEKQRDGELFAILTAEQRTKYIESLGMPIHIDWEIN